MYVSSNKDISISNNIVILSIGKNVTIYVFCIRQTGEQMVLIKIKYHRINLFSIVSLLTLLGHVSMNLSKVQLCYINVAGFIFI